MKVRLLHLADVHLDTPFQNKEQNVRMLLRESIRSAFEESVNLALKENVNAVLIAGDLFDNDSLSFATENFLISQFHRLEDQQIPVYYAPGNHDPWGANDRITKIAWPDNVHIFTGSEAKTYPLRDTRGQVIAQITGAGHERKKEDRNLAARFPQPPEGTLAIGLLHALVTGAGGAAEHERYAPCTLKDLQSKGYDYWALGHIHASGILSEKPLVIYPGNLMGRNHSERGKKGAYLVEIDDEGNQKVEFHCLAPLRWAAVDINMLAEVHNFDSLQEKIVAGITENSEIDPGQGKIFLRVELRGPTPLYSELQKTENIMTLTEEIKEALGLDFLELVTDNLMRLADPDSFRHESHILSTVLALLERLRQDDALLLEFAPRELAGSTTKEESLIGYLRSLLEGLDYEAVSRLVEGENR